jgi:hypothetical protein
VTGASNTSVTWSISPAFGRISSTGRYTAPATVSAEQSVTVRAISVADPTAFATMSLIVTPRAGQRHAVISTAAMSPATDSALITREHE